MIDLERVSYHLLKERGWISEGCPSNNKILMELPEQSKAYGRVREALGKGSYDEAVVICTLVSIDREKVRDWGRTMRRRTGKARERDGGDQKIAPESLSRRSLPSMISLIRFKWSQSSRLDVLTSGCHRRDESPSASVLSSISTWSSSSDFAISSCLQVLESNVYGTGNTTPYLLARSTAFSKGGELEAALRDAKAAIKSKPDDPKVSCSIEELF